MKSLMVVIMLVHISCKRGCIHNKCMTVLWKRSWLVPGWFFMDFVSNLDLIFNQFGRKHSSEYAARCWFSLDDAYLQVILRLISNCSNTIPQQTSVICSTSQTSCGNNLQSDLLFKAVVPRALGLPVWFSFLFLWNIVVWLITGCKCWLKEWQS